MEEKMCQKYTKCYTLQTFCNLLFLLLILWKMASELNEYSDRNLLFLQKHGS